MRTLTKILFFISLYLIIEWGIARAIEIEWPEPPAPATNSAPTTDNRQPIPVNFI